MMMMFIGTETLVTQFVYERSRGSNKDRCVKEGLRNVTVSDIPSDSHLDIPQSCQGE
jgi:hypothetical protein